MSNPNKIQSVFSIFWPEVCPFCGKACRAGICDPCRKELEQLRIRDPRCMRCGKPIRYPEQEYCYDCSHNQHDYDRGYSLWLHRKPVNHSIYQFKYHNQRHFAVYYAKEMAEAFGRNVSAWAPDLIMPVPLHKRRMRKRGYNQALLLAQELGKRWNIPVDPCSMYRNKQTDPQKNLDPGKRKGNLRQAFALRDSFRPVPAVLLIDDIYTTGNTMDAAAWKLKEQGVQKVFFLTISIGQGY